MKTNVELYKKTTEKSQIKSRDSTVLNNFETIEFTNIYILNAVRCPYVMYVCNVGRGQFNRE